MWFVSFFLVFSKHCFARVHNLHSEIGENFIDNFLKFDASIWVRSHDFVKCYEKDCVYFNADNLQYIRLPPYGDQSATNALHITMRNDCEASWCCVGERCSSYSVGEIRSVHLYDQGSFRFMLQPAATNFGINGVSSCFGLQSPGMPRIGIRACFPSQSNSDREYVVLNYQHERNVQIDIPLRINIFERRTRFKLDWHSDRVDFYASGELLHSFDSTEFRIFYQPLYISVTFIPTNELPQVMEGASLSLYLTQARYVQFPGPVEENDFFIFSSTFHSFIFRFIIFGTIGCVTFAVCMRQEEEFESDEETVTDDLVDFPKSATPRRTNGGIRMKRNLNLAYDYGFGRPKEKKFGMNFKRFQQRKSREICDPDHTMDSMPFSLTRTMESTLTPTT